MKFGPDARTKKEGEVSEAAPEHPLPDTEQATSEGEAIEATPAAPVREEPPQATKPTRHETLEGNMERQRNRPPLPDIIPQDPGFVFGPSSEPKEEQQPTTPGRVFRIERPDVEAPVE